MERHEYSERVGRVGLEERVENAHRTVLTKLQRWIPLKTTPASLQKPLPAVSEAHCRIRGRRLQRRLDFSNQQVINTTQILSPQLEIWLVNCLSIDESLFSLLKNHHFLLTNHHFLY